MAKKKVMILWSGGIDSSAMLKMYLERTDYEIFATKIIYKSKSNCCNDRIDKELQAIAKLKPKLQAIRPFQYHEIIVDNPNQVLGTDVPIFGTLAIYPAQTFKIDEIVIGFVSDIRHEQLKYVLQKIDLLNHISELFYINSKGIWSSFPKFVVPKFYNKKKYYMEQLGDLVMDTWFCRYPAKAGNTNGCGYCVACSHVKKVLPEMIQL